MKATEIRIGDTITNPFLMEPPTFTVDAIEPLKGHTPSYDAINFSGVDADGTRHGLTLFLYEATK